jgi:stress response protein YsnF
VDPGQIVIPLGVEEVSVSRRQVVTGRVRVARVTREREEWIDELLSSRDFEIERRPIDQPIDAMPAVREEEDVIVIPVVEEVLVVERRLVLKEEIRLRRVDHVTRHRQAVVVRRQEAVVTRLAGDVDSTPEQRKEEM